MEGVLGWSVKELPCATPNVLQKRFDVVSGEGYWCGEMNAERTTYRTLDEVKSAVKSGTVIHWQNSGYTVKQSKFEPEDFNVICSSNNHYAYLSNDYKAEDFYSLGSDKPTIQDPKPALKPGVIYSADNGMRICLQCAGNSAKFTGRDISGQRVIRIPVAETVDWKSMFGEDLSCERGCTTYPQPA